MVTKMMRWRPWPPISSRKFEVRLAVRRIEGFEGAGEKDRVLIAEVRWKGPKLALGALRRSIKRNCTKEEEIREGIASIEWNEEFESVCILTFHKENAFYPWEIEFRVFNAPKQGSRKKASVIGKASLNLAEFASTAEEEIEINLPLLLPSASSESHPSLNLALSLLELRTSQELSETVQRAIVPAPLSPSSGDTLPSEKDELSALKAGLRKVKILTDFVSSRKAQKTCRDDGGSDGRCSARSEDADYPYPFDTDSLDDEVDEEEAKDGKDGDSIIRKSFNYGTLATANYVGGSIYSDMMLNGEHEDLVYYSHRRSDVGCSHGEEMGSSVNEQALLLTSKRSLLPWRKRKLSFRSPKAKGEPLLKKGNGDEGGDDIDYDRRLLSSSDESLSGGGHKADEYATANSPSLSDFGDDNFAVGSWESKQVISRDGHMKLSTNVFFASIDQRSERAAGESACTVLVAVIADWFQSNRDAMPIKSQFDSLILEGSLEWRNLCGNQTYRDRFPDKHFDLDTVVEAKIRTLSVVAEKSFIGFFQPEGMDGDSGFDFLHGAMTFDNIWNEISQAGPECLYVVSWNDHFFVLKVERDAYYIIDTLGERLFEGCDQSYILKFDESTSIHRVSNGEQENSEEEMVCKGKESCKEYIKSFLAAIPIRELLADIKKGRMASTPLHHRLQIEFHYTEPSKEVVSETALVVSQSEELLVEEAPEAKAMPISPPSEEEEEESNDEFFVRREEPVVPVFSLTPAVEVV